jgi:hypothetical protein
MRANRRRLESFVAADYLQAVKLLRLLGFTVERPTPIGVNGSLFSRFHVGFAINFVPERGRLLMCDYDMARVPPEMEKVRRVVVARTRVLLPKLKPATYVCVLTVSPRRRPATAIVSAIAAGSQHRTISRISHRTAVSSASCSALGSLVM